jgi:hypothetical protein
LSWLEGVIERNQIKEVFPTKEILIPPSQKLEELLKNID